MTNRPQLAAASAPPSAALGVVTVVMTLLGWSSVPLFITHFSSLIDFWTQNGWRYGFSALLWAPVLVIGAWRGNLPRGLWRASVVPAIANALGQITFTWSFYKIDPATATFGLRMQIVFVAVGAYLLFPSERAVLRRPAAWMGILMVLVGIGGTVFLGPAASGGVAEKQTHFFGVVLAITSGLCFAAYGLSVRKFMHGFHPVTAFAAISQYTAVALVGLMLVMGRDVVTGAWDGGAGAWSLSGGQMSLLLLSAVIGIALGHVFYYISIARLGVAVSGGVIQLQPFCVALGQYFIFDKALTAGQTVSGSVAVMGAMALLWVQWRLTRAVTRSARAAPMPIDPRGLPEVIPNGASIGPEAAEMDVVPVAVTRTAEQQSN